MESTPLGFLVAVVAALAFGLGNAVDRFLLKRVGLSQLTDAHAEQLAVDIAKNIQGEMQYPGQIKVTVIREVRSISYAN